MHVLYSFEKKKKMLKLQGIFKTAYSCQFDQQKKKKIKSRLYDLESRLYDLKIRLYDLESRLYDLKSRLYDLESRF
jgi:hypothetical protein